ncbi:MAG: hypothetical protein QNK03_20260 [Myxococcota bacterium]|nr:hypothetical protein [Myxococcota bacterium]
MRGLGAGRHTAPWWTELSDEALLDVRLCDLGLRLEGTPLAGRLERVHGELAAAGLRFRPYAWLSNGWFTPHGVSGFAIPFYLAHPRLTRLERALMGEAEGDREAWCLQLMRHETGHALDNAYRLHRRRSWREQFGPFGEPYRVRYTPNPRSRAFVRHLDGWYAQSHPGEDFAETFAVWLQPRSGWRRRYAGWGALRKLEYVDALMAELRGEPPRLRTRERTDSLLGLRHTLREHYRRRLVRYTRRAAAGRGREYVR